MTLLRDADPAWADRAAEAMALWRAAAGALLSHIHHIGSASVPGLIAKPVIDLMPVTQPGAEPALRRIAADLGYEVLGANGLPGRLYCRKDDPLTGARTIQAHCYPEGHGDIRRHLVFRDALRAQPALCGAYAAEKRRCATLHGDDRAAYGRCKASFIDSAEAVALAALTP